ncbi:MAG: restriction endonuclease subunit S, partial [Pseudanabaena sp.]
MRQKSFLRDAEQRMTGAVGQRRVPVNFLKETNLAIPPLNEQRRIVDKLDRIGDRQRSARNELNHIPKLIARYKQSVLAAACSGKLTEDWRIKQNLENSWQSTTLSEVIIDK